MGTVRLAIALTVAAMGLAACGDDDDAEVRTVTAPAPEASTEEASTAAGNGDAILIETRVTDARRHTGEIVDGSVLGESAFCRGGKTSGGSDGAEITTTFRCRGGTLEVQFAPTQRSQVQGAPWQVVSGTGRFEGLRGGGSMVAAFESDDPDSGREVFTGTVEK
jgi:hypothetical protein